MEEINKELYGKTIKRIVTNYDENFDDEDSIIIEFTDNTKIEVKSSFGGYTGESKDEYPCFVLVGNLKEGN